MKTFAVALAAFALGWLLASTLHGIEIGKERLWLVSSVKAPGRMAIVEIQEDMKRGRYEVAKGKIDALMNAWQRFESESPALKGQGIGEIMVTFSRLNTNGVPSTVPAKPQ